MPAMTFLALSASTHTTHILRRWTSDAATFFNVATDRLQHWKSDPLDWFVKTYCNGYKCFCFIYSV